MVSHAEMLIKKYTGVRLEKPSGSVDSATSLTARRHWTAAAFLFRFLSGFIFKRSRLLIQLSMLMMQSDRRRV